LQRVLFYYDIGVHRVILVGNSKTIDILTKAFSNSKASGYQVIKRLRDFNMETAEELAKFLKDKEVDEIIQSDPNLNQG